MNGVYYKPPFIVGQYVWLMVIPSCSEQRSEEGKLVRRVCSAFDVIIFDTEKNRAVRVYLTLCDALRLVKFIVDNIELVGDIPESRAAEYVKQLKEVTEKMILDKDEDCWW
jgi:predicted O-methyltransferase YrrM